MHIYYCKRKLPNLTINKSLSNNMKIILKKIDPIKYKNLKINYIPSQRKNINRNLRNSPW